MVVPQFFSVRDRSGQVPGRSLSPEFRKIRQTPFLRLAGSICPAPVLLKNGPRHVGQKFGSARRPFLITLHRCGCIMYLYLFFNPRPALVFGRTSPAEGGGARFCPLPCLTREGVAVARRARWQSKALDEYFLSFFILTLYRARARYDQLFGKKRCRID